MNKKLFLMIVALLILSVVLSSCSNSKKKESTTPAASFDEASSLLILEPDYSMPDEYYSSMNQGGRINLHYLSTPYGKYQYVDNFIYYSQYGNTQYMKLCTKTDCDHTTNECDSYVGNTHIGYHDGKIYYTEFSSNTTLYLVSMDMDGTNHEVIKPITSYSDIPSYILCVGFHNGYYYFIASEGESFGAIGNKDNNLYRIRLDDNSEYEVLFSNSIVPVASMITIFEDNIFFYVNNTGTDYELYKLSLQNTSLYHMTDEWVAYTNSYFESGMGYCYKHNDGFYTLDLNSKHLNKVADSVIEDGWQSIANYYPDNIYVITFTSTKDDKGYNNLYNSQTLYIFDRQYNLLDTLTLETTGTPFGCMLEDTGNYIIISSDYRKPADYFLLKSEIGNNITLNKIGK